jgi:hypothetical protein
VLNAKHSGRVSESTAPGSGRASLHLSQAGKYNHAMICYAMLCCAVLYYAVLCLDIISHCLTHNTRFPSFLCRDINQVKGYGTYHCYRMSRSDYAANHPECSTPDTASSSASTDRSIDTGVKCCANDIDLEVKCGKSNTGKILHNKKPPAMVSMQRSQKSLAKAKSAVAKQKSTEHESTYASLLAERDEQTAKFRSLLERNDASSWKYFVRTPDTVDRLIESDDLVVKELVRLRAVKQLPPVCNHQQPATTEQGEKPAGDAKPKVAA